MECGGCPVCWTPLGGPCGTFCWRGRPWASVRPGGPEKNREIGACECSGVCDGGGACWGAAGDSAGVKKDENRELLPETSALETLGVLKLEFLVPEDRTEVLRSFLGLTKEKKVSTSFPRAFSSWWAVGDGTSSPFLRRSSKRIWAFQFSKSSTVRPMLMLRSEEASAEPQSGSASSPVSPKSCEILSGDMVSNSLLWAKPAGFLSHECSCGLARW